MKSGVHTTDGGPDTGPAGITEVARGQGGSGEARENLGVRFEIGVSRTQIEDFTGVTWARQRMGGQLT